MTVLVNNNEHIIIVISIVIQVGTGTVISISIRSSVLSVSQAAVSLGSSNSTCRKGMGALTTVASVEGVCHFNNNEYEANYKQ